MVASGGGYRRNTAIGMTIIYKRFNRWVKAGIIEKLFRELHVQGIAETDILVRLLDSMTVSVHPDACGALKKTVNKQSDAPKGD